MSQSPLHGTGSLHTRAGAFDATRRQAIAKPTGLKAGWNPNKFDQSKRQVMKALKNKKWHQTTNAAVTEEREAIIEAIIAEMKKNKKKVTVVKRIGKRLYITVKKRKDIKEAIMEALTKKQSGHHGLLGFEIKRPSLTNPEPPDMETSPGWGGPAGRVAHRG